MARKQEKMIYISKQVGETPLEALERWRSTRKDLAGVSMTYAGRLDPMAHGTLLILIGEECKNKEKYLGLDKEYEVEIVFGASTDTFDALGLASLGISTMTPPVVYETSKSLSDAVSNSSSFIYKGWEDRYIGKFEQRYPAYSSKTVGGKQLHELARIDQLPDIQEIPTKDVEIYSIEVINDVHKINAIELEKVILDKISLVKGDFRQDEIIKRWKEVLSDKQLEFNVLKTKVICSSGTYMRSLADRIGNDFGTGAFALSIKRTRIIKA